jgi:hypothetical protein
MLYGAKINVVTHHKNLTFQNLNLQQVLCCQKFLEECSLTFKYKPGPNNIIADAFSHLPCTPSSTAEIMFGPVQNVDSGFSLFILMTMAFWIAF